MQIQRNGQRHLWLLSGTGEGPFLAEALIEQGWDVTVSVVSSLASEAYLDLPINNIMIGQLSSEEKIKEILIEAKVKHNGFACVIDATHPFATLITSQLKAACSDIGQELIRFERPKLQTFNANLFKNFQDLFSNDMSDQRILLAIGSRYLPEASFLARKAGAKVFARIFPTPFSFRMGLKSAIPQSNLAMMRPLKGEGFGELESHICKRWSINRVLCRQSGGFSERLWQFVCKREGIKLSLISRPDFDIEIDLVDELELLLAKLDRL